MPYLFLLFVLLAPQALAAPETPLTWMSEEYPPYNFTTDAGEPQGIAVDTLTAIWQRLQSDHKVDEIRFLPWARAYTRLQREPGTALFSMTYTPARQQLFRFVGPLIPVRVVLLARKHDQLTVTGPEQLHQLRIGVVREDIGEQLLLEQGIGKDNLVFSNLAANLVQLLHRERVDAIAYSYDVAAWNMLRAGIDPGDYEVVYTLLEGELGYAFHRDTDPQLLQQLQKALDALKAEGAVERIRGRYLGDPGAIYAPVQRDARYAAAPPSSSWHQPPRARLVAERSIIARQPMPPAR